MKALLTIASALLLGLGLTHAHAADWPQFQGPDRSNVSKETGLLKQWPAKGPALVWTFTDAGVGYSSPSIVGDRLYMTGAREDESFLYALDVANGKEVWKTKLGKRFTFKGNQWGDGPRAAPTVADGLIYALDGGGELLCAQASDGKEVWRKFLPVDLKAEVNKIGGGPDKLGWGFCAAPLVDGDLVILNAGGPEGTLAALNRKTGAVVWRSKDLTDQASYSSPVVAEVNGVRQYIVLLYRGVAGVAAKDGSLLWFYDKKPAYSDVLIPAPIYHDGHVYVSNGLGGAGCDLIKVTAAGGKFKATRVYANKNMKSNTGGIGLLDGHVYGYSDRRGWICQSWMGGEIKWGEKNALRGGGSLTVADGMLYCYGEDDGEVVLAEASPKGWAEKGRFTIPQHTRFKAPSGRDWTYPVVANGKLYLRDQELLFCYDVKAK